MKNTLFVLFTICTLYANAQKFMTRTGSIDFSANTPLEKIEGNNKSVACLLDTKSGSLDYVVQVKSFVFSQQLMQEHFNENYMESDKFPKSTFKGTIRNLTSIDFSKDGEYNAEVSGKLTIHGVTKDVNALGKIIVRSGKVILKSTLSALLADYKIAIPGAVKDKISKEVKINVNCVLESMK